MPGRKLKKKGLFAGVIGLVALAGICLFANVHGISSFRQAYDISFFGTGTSQADARGGIHKAVEPPYKKIETTEIDLGGGRHKLVVSRGGRTRDYLMRSEIWREYMDIGGVESVVGSPTSNEYAWYDGKRQDFERGHWLYWSEKTGVVMDYTPFEKMRSENEKSLQAPVFFAAKPMVEWDGDSEDKYYITQDFGVNGHLGQDLAISGNPSPGYEVRPIGRGQVVFAGWAGSDAWGNLVLIRHRLRNGREYFSQYAHLYDLPQVFPGQQVDKESVLGYVGNTGKSTGPHLDLQIKEIPDFPENYDEKAVLESIGRGYTKRRVTFNGNINIDPDRGIIYYRPSYFISNFNNGAVLLGATPKNVQIYNLD